MVGDDGNNYADDVQWTLQVSLDDDPDEVAHGVPARDLLLVLGDRDGQS